LQPSANFSFLASHAQLVRLGTLAERYFREDANTTLIKLRQFGEAMAQTIAARLREYSDPRENQKDLLERLEDRGAIPRDAARLFHEIRIVGNKATHNVRIPIYPAGHSDSNPATRSNPFPATCTDLISARRGVPSQQVDDGHLMVRGFRSRLC